MVVSGSSKQGTNLAERYKKDLILLKEGEAAYHTGDLKTASVHLNAFLQSEPDHLGALELLAKSLWQLEMFAEVIPICDQMSRLHPAENGYLELKAMSLRALGHFGACAKILERIHSTRLLADVESCQAHLVKGLIEHDPKFAFEFQRDAKSCFEKHGFYFANANAAKDWLIENTKNGSRVSRPRPAMR